MKIEMTCRCGAKGKVEAPDHDTFVTNLNLSCWILASADGEPGDTQYDTCPDCDPSFFREE